MRVKVGSLDGRVVNVAPEHDDCERAARSIGEPVKVVWARALAAAQEARRVSAAGASSKARLRELGGVGRRVLGRRRLLARRRARARARWASARSPSPPSRPRWRAASSTARAAWPRRVGIAHETISTDELARAGYRRNDRVRCFHCKTELYDALAALARERGYAALLSGANADDAGDWRPGLRAAAEHGVLHPLLEAGVDQGRRCARSPSACGCPARASRRALPGLPDPLRHAGRPRRRCARIDAAERAVRALGFARAAGPPPRRASAALELRRPTCDRALARERARSTRRSGRPATPTPTIDREPFRSGSAQRWMPARAAAAR